MLIVNIKEKKRGFRTIIKDINFQVPKATSVMIIGTSGAGKSTINSCILDSTRFNGSVSYGDNKIAFIEQHPALNNRETVFEAVYYSCLYDNCKLSKAEAKQIAAYYINMFGLSYVENNKISKISGGQRQRVAIAAELVRNSDIIICDEPDSGLDAGTSRKFAENIQRIAKNEKKTCLVISHLVQNCDLYDRILVLAKDDDNIGGIAYYGSPKDALEYFGVKEFYEILIKINTKAEEGENLGGHFIKKFKKYKGRTA